MTAYFPPRTGAKRLATRVCGGPFRTMRAELRRSSLTPPPPPPSHLVRTAQMETVKSSLRGTVVSCMVYFMVELVTFVSRDGVAVLAALADCVGLEKSALMLALSDAAQVKTDVRSMAVDTNARGVPKKHQHYLMPNQLKVAEAAVLKIARYCLLQFGAALRALKSAENSQDSHALVHAYSSALKHYIASELMFKGASKVARLKDLNGLSLFELLDPVCAPPLPLPPPPPPPAATTALTSI